MSLRFYRVIITYQLCIIVFALQCPHDVITMASRCHRNRPKTFEWKWWSSKDTWKSYNTTCCTLAVTAFSSPDGNAPPAPACFSTVARSCKIARFTAASDWAISAAGAADAVIDAAASCSVCSMADENAPSVAGTDGFRDVAEFELPARVEPAADPA